MSAAKVVACGIEATIELKAGKGSTRKSKFIGLALVDGTLKIAFGRGSDALHFALTSIQNVVANKMKEGYATFILGVARHEPQQLFVSKSEPVQLERLLEAMNEAVGVTRRGKAPMPQGDAAALLERFFPEQLKKQLKALKDMASGDAPQPAAGHKQLMMVFDGKGVTPSQIGKKLAELASSLRLTTHARADMSNAQMHVAVCRDASKAVQLQLSVRTCTHHKLTTALYLDVDAAEGVDASALRAALLATLGQGALVSLSHGAVKERLAEGLAVRIVHGLRRGGGAAARGGFASRLELRWEQMEASASPLGVCEVEFFEEGGRMAVPTCVLLRLNKEPCAAWQSEHADRKTSVLATTLVARLEVFCTRLAASAAGGGGGAASRPKLLVAGWLPGVQTAPFVTRGFRFDQAPDASLGFKMLKTDADRARAAGKPATDEGGAGDSPAPPPGTTAQQRGKRKRVTEDDGGSGGTAGAPDAKQPTFAPWPVRNAAATGASTSGAAASSAAAAAAAGEAAPSDDAHGESQADEPQPAPYTFGGGDEDDVIELGEISNLGRMAQQAAQAVPEVPDDHTQGNAEPETQQATVPQATEGMDDIDAALAELLPASRAKQAEAHTQGNAEPETQEAAAPRATEGMDDIDAALAGLLPS